MSARKFFSEGDQEKIMGAIKKAEHQTSGEIRVHIEDACKGEVLDAAAQWFSRLKMHKTKLRNGVLVYLAVEDRKLAIIGDRGINAVVPPDFWDKASALMLAHFSEGRFTDGLVDGILLAGEQLKAHFPYQNDDKNELPDTISFDKE
jgi:uncharacterized membrane protein